MTLQVKPVPELLLGFTDAQEAQAVQVSLLNESIPKVTALLERLADQPRIRRIVRRNPEPVYPGRQTIWMNG
jgi:hypothetical protein